MIKKSRAQILIAVFFLSTSNLSLMADESETVPASSADSPSPVMVSGPASPDSVSAPKPFNLTPPSNMRPPVTRKPRMTFDEWLEKSPERKAEWDLNKDGVVDQNEKRELGRRLYMKRLQQKKNRPRQTHKMPKPGFPGVVGPNGSGVRGNNPVPPQGPPSVEVSETTAS